MMRPQRFNDRARYAKASGELAPRVKPDHDRPRAADDRTRRSAATFGLQIQRDTCPRQF
jgi:hypothetical protein